MSTANTQPKKTVGLPSDKTLQQAKSLLVK